MKKIFSLFGLFGLLLGFTACAHQQNTDTSSDTTSSSEVIKIGMITPLTGSLASLGEDMSNSVNLFLSQNPMWGEKKVELVLEDDQCNPAQAVNAANKLISQDKVQVLFIDSCSGAYLSVAPVANRNKVLLISSLSTSPEITEASGEYGFRNAPSDELSSTVIVDYMSEQYKTIALFSENTDFSQSYREKIKEKGSAHGMEVVVDEVFNPEMNDAKTALLNVQESDPDALAIVVNDDTMAGIMAKQARELGLDIPLICTDVCTGQAFFDVGKDATNGTVISVTAIDPENPKMQAFTNAFVTAYGHEPNSPSYAGLAWDRTAIMKNAIDAVGNDAMKIVDWLHNMPVYDGIAGMTEFDENGDGSILPNLMVAKDGKFEILK